MENINDRILKLVFETDIRDNPKEAEDTLNEAMSLRRRSVHYLVNKGELFEVEKEDSLPPLMDYVSYDGSNISMEDLISYLRAQLKSAKEFLWKERQEKLRST